MQKQNQQFSFCLERKFVEGKRGSGKEKKGGEGWGVLSFAKSMLVMFSLFPSSQQQEMQECAEEG